MKAVLFYPRIENSYLPSFAPLGLLSIATCLNANGHEATICDRFFSNEEIMTILERLKPDVVGVSVISNEFINDASSISKAANKFGVPVVWGGPLATFIPKEILESGLVDYVSLNEGEFTWLDIAEAFDKNQSFDNIKGLAYIKDGKFNSNGTREFADLSLLPKLDWDLIEPERYFQVNYGYENMLTIYYSKGCTGRCGFCYNHRFHCSTRRKRSLETVIEEMRYLVEKHGAGGFEFTDDLLFANKSEVVDFCNALIDSGINTCWSGFMRIDVVDDAETYKLMYKSGCRSLKYGVESGSERILKRLGKNFKAEKAEKVIGLCQQAGITPIPMFIFGFPGETEEDIKETVTLAKKLKKAVLGFSFLTPIPGTRMYEQLSVNVSEIPSTDLKVIKLFFRLNGLFTQTDNSSGEQISKLIRNTLKSMTGGGIIHFLRSGFFSFYRFLESLTIFFHPKIRKKYGLYFTERT